MTTASQANPFADFDFSKMMDFQAMAEQFKVPGVDMQAMMETQRKNIEAITNANKIAMEGAQAIARRQTESLRQAMEEARSTMSELAAAGAPEEKLAAQTEITRKAFETAIANMRELAEMGAKSNSEALEQINARVSESLEEIREAIEVAAKQAKRG